MNILNDISAVYVEQVAESAVPGKPAEKLGAVTAIPKSEQEAAKERILAKTAAKRAKMKKETEIEESQKPNDGNLANNYPPYDKITRGDVIAGRLGKDEMGGKKKKSKGMKEGFSNWRQDLAEVMDDIEASKEIKEKKVNNKIKINPEMKEAVEQLGGELIEMVEVDEAVYGGEKKEPKDTRYTVTAADKKGNTAAYQKYKAGDNRYKAAPHLGEETVDEAKQPFPFKKVKGQMEKARQGSVYAKKGNPGPVPNTTDSEKKETTRFSKMFHASEKAKREKQNADKARRSSTFYKDTHPASAPKMKKANEEFDLEEKTLTSGETKKKEEIVKSMKKKAGDFEKRYPGRGKEVMYATATKMAKKVAEQMDEPTEPAVDKASEMQKKKIQVQKVRELTTRLQSARKGVY
jgi:hypothetical protein